MVGIYKAVPPRANGTTSGQFRAVLVANNVKRMVRDAGALLTCTLCNNAWLHVPEHQPSSSCRLPPGSPSMLCLDGRDCSPLLPVVCASCVQDALQH